MRLGEILRVIDSLLRGPIRPNRWAMDRERVGLLLQDVARFLDRMASRDRHHIACGIMFSDNTVTLGVNIVSSLGPASVCAEQVALGEALKSAKPRADLVVALRATFQHGKRHEIVPPCGRCRELLWQYTPIAQVVVPRTRDGGVECEAVELVGVADLLPFPFVRRDRAVLPRRDVRSM